MSTGMSQDRPEVACSADSGKAFVPELTPEEICDRFAAVLGNPGNAVRVNLRFTLRGMASAEVAMWRAGQWQPLPLYQLAVMDRRFNLSDIDRLAQDVASGMTMVSEAEHG